MILAIPRIPALYFIFAMLAAVCAYKFLRKDTNDFFDAPSERLYFALIFSAAAIGSYLPSLTTSLLRSEIVTGKSLIFALFFAFLGAEFLKKGLGIRRGTGDSLALSLPIALAVARIGCLFAHCCLGQPTTAAFGLLVDDILRHPIAIYEIMFHCAFFSLNLFLVKKDLLSGRLLRIYVLSYCVFRFLLEFIRVHPADILGLTIFQWIAILLFCALSYLIVKDSLFASTREPA